VPIVAAMAGLKWHVNMSSQTANSERRKNSRREPPSLIYVELGPSNGGMMRDLSEEGFALRAMIPVHVGDKTPFSFLLSTTARIDGEGEILWVEERGRVAGIRFVGLPQLARTHIRSWLNGTLESPENKEEPQKAVVSDAQSFDELRKELHSSVLPATTEQPKPHWSISRPTPPPDAAAAEPPATPPPLPPVSMMKELEEEQEAASLAEPDSFPGLPDISTTQNAIAISFEPLPPAEESGAEAHWKRELPKQPAFPEIPATERYQESPLPELPDISQILIQPPRKEAEYSSRTATLQPVESLSQSVCASQGTWTEWFTLSRAVGIMSILALVVAASAYHREFGEGLIWLGEQLGGSGTSQVSPPSPDGNTSGGESNAPPSNDASSSGAATPTETPPVDKPTNSPPMIPKDTPPPVTPLSGISPGTDAEVGQETGLAEYSHAIELLHRENAPEDTSEAVRLLWISVEKGNPNAELTLANLYWHGEGVGRNCDQTRILLSAAARKGNADARKRLQQFQQEGCE
jgi:PilZ domain